MNAPTSSSPQFTARPARTAPLAALCALTHKPMVGSGLRAGAVGMDKWATKLVAEAVGIHTAPGRLVAAADTADLEFETVVVVKPASAGSSFGVALARDASQLRDALRCATRFDDRILIEDVVPGREMEIQTNGLFDTQ